MTIGIFALKGELKGKILLVRFFSFFVGYSKIVVYRGIHI